VRGADVPLGLKGTYVARELCDLTHAETAQVLATYGRDFYAGRPALTVNRVGEGQAYCITSRNDERFLDDLYGALSAALSLLCSLDADLPYAVSAQLRTNGHRTFIFLMSFGIAPARVDLGAGSYTDLLSGAQVSGEIELETYGLMVLAR
jgi:beta-galactosidase